MDSQDKFGAVHTNRNSAILQNNDASLAHDDLMMDMILNQSVDYNNALSSDNLVPMSHDTPDSFSEMESELSNSNAGQLSMNEQPMSTMMQPTHLTGQDATTSSSAKGKLKKKKESSGQHSSLLNALATPLLHAIPVLARNCLNFEDFLAQAALHGQNGLLGPKEKTYGGSSDADKLSLDTDRSMMLKIESPWRIRVLGLPATGAKSRVETQIKICLQLVDTNGNLATNWTHMQLPDHMVAKDKLKRKPQKMVANDKASLVESKTLRLEAAVVCDSQPDNEIIMCTNCVHRERKRLKRKRDNKVTRATSKEGNAAKLAALAADDLPDLTDENVMAEERRRILLFNCPEYVDFQSGETTLPTRVTCYCRHHSEKVGFRIVFTIKDVFNHVIATGRSPPIMITDDHKSSKLQAATRKRPRNEFDASTVEAETALKKKAVSASHGQGDGETDSGISSPMASTPPTPTSQLEDLPNSPMAKSILEGPSTIGYDLSAADTTHTADDMLGTNHQRAPVTGGQSFLSHMHDSAYGLSMTQMPNGELYDFLQPQDLSMNQLLSQHELSTTQSHIQDQSQLMMQVPPSSFQTTQPLQDAHPTQSSMLLPQQSTSQQRRKSGTLTTCEQQQFRASNVYAKMQQKQALERSKPSNLPKLHRLIPSEGPVYGGSEVTVLGSNFYEGLTCLFGDNPAIPTHCWSSNTLLCILPPASSAGPVVVSFKEHPLMLEGQDVVLFTYFDESDRALMELALQVVGLKTMGKVEDARQIAMRIVQGDSSSRKGQSFSASNVGGVRIEYREGLTVAAAMAVYENARTLFIHRLEEQVIAALFASMRLNTRYMGNISLTNRNQHNLLHLAALCGYDRLVKVLLTLGCDVDMADNNGFTALHFASWTGKEAIVRELIHKANVEVRNIMGKTPEKLALEAGHEGVVRLFKQTANHKTKTKKKEVRTIRRPLTDFIPSETVASAKALLPVSITNLLSNFYTFSVNTPHAKSFVHTVGQVYNFMLDPF